MLVSMLFDSLKIERTSYYFYNIAVKYDDGR